MPMPIEAREIAVGDWSPTYGTVTEVVEHKNLKGEVYSYDFIFFNNAYTLTNIDPAMQLMMIQGGADIVHDGMPDPSQIRPGLKEDHAKD